MANYRVEFFGVDNWTGYPEDHPFELIWFQRLRLTRKDMDNILRHCTWDDMNTIGYIYRNDEYIGMVEVEVTDLYKGTAIIINGKHWHKHQWKRNAA